MAYESPCLRVLQAVNGSTQAKAGHASLGRTRTHLHSPVHCVRRPTQTPNIHVANFPDSETHGERVCREVFPVLLPPGGHCDHPVGLLYTGHSISN